MGVVRSGSGPVCGYWLLPSYVGRWSWTGLSTYVTRTGPRYEFRLRLHVQMYCTSLAVTCICRLPVASPYSVLDCTVGYTVQSLSLYVSSPIPTVCIITDTVPRYGTCTRKSEHIAHTPHTPHLFCLCLMSDDRTLSTMRPRVRLAMADGGAHCACGRSCVVGENQKSRSPEAH